MCMSPVFIKNPQSDVSPFPKWQRFIQVPCGKCDECRISHAKEWGVRCMCQLMSMTEEQRNNSYFVTLTYDEKHNPFRLKQRDMQLFIKRLRKYFTGVKIKYFYCGEYGTQTLRPHYHMILFNCPLTQLNYRTKNFNGDLLWESPELSQLWGKGFVVVGNVTLKSASYTARYCLKKNDTDCYMRCSQGFGKDFFIDHMDDIIRNGYVSVVCNGKIIKSKIPKYFLKLYRKFLADDDEYKKFLSWRSKKTQKYIDEISKQDKLTSGASYILRKSIGLADVNVEYEQMKKRIIQNALGDLYSKRELNDNIMF